MSETKSDRRTTSSSSIVDDDGDEDEDGSEGGDEIEIDDTQGEADDDEVEGKGSTSQAKIKVKPCLVCKRPHTSKEDLSKEGKAAKELIAKTLGFKTGGNQYKLGHSKAARAKGVTLVNATTKYEPEMRWCRMLSTVARAYLLTKFSSVEEVQCAFDEANGRFVLSTNQDAQTTALSKADLPGWLAGNNHKPIAAQPKQFTVRAKRHIDLVKGADGPATRLLDARQATISLSSTPRSGGPQDLSSSCGAKNGKEKSDFAKFLEMRALSDTQMGETAETDKKASQKRKHDDKDIGDEPKEAQAKASKKSRGERRAKTTLPADWSKNLDFVVSSNSSQVVHTETRIIYQMKDALAEEKKRDPKAFEAKYAGKTIWVAGVMRPCLCCFVRLKRLEKEFESEGLIVKLKHKPRPGLFWPTSNAMNGMTSADFMFLKTYIEDLQKQGQGRLYMTDESGKGYTIDSDTEDDEGDEAEDS